MRQVKLRRKSRALRLAWACILLAAVALLYWWFGQASAAAAASPHTPALINAIAEPAAAAAAEPAAAAAAELAIAMRGRSTPQFKLLPPLLPKPDSPARALLKSIFAKHGYEPAHLSQTRPADYMNAVYDAEAESLLRVTEEELVVASEEVVKSLQIMARLGHRTRVVDLIGGEHLPPDLHKLRLVTHAKLFQASNKPRDYATDKIYSSVPCDNEPGIDMCSNSAHYLHQRTVFRTMENVPCMQNFALCATTRLTSDIPLPYCSYHDFGILAPGPGTVEEKPMLAAAFISNCAFAKRNAFVLDLVNFTMGETHSYGGCMKRDRVPPVPTTSRDGEKLAVLQLHKFSLAFENSETVDYVTEKFFGSLCAGSVPVVIGAPNTAFFAPDTGIFPYESFSLIHTKDFHFDASRVAALMMELSATPSAYAEMLKWKLDGYSLDYKAVLDLTTVHSACRECVLLADELRHEHGANVYDLRVLQSFTEAGDEFFLFVRERGTYAFTKLGFPRKPNRMVELVRRTLMDVREREKNLWKNNENRERASGQSARVYAFFLPRPARLAVLTNEDVFLLQNGTELEVIFV